MKKYFLDIGSSLVFKSLLASTKYSQPKPFRVNYLRFLLDQSWFGVQPSKALEGDHFVSRFLYLLFCTNCKGKPMCNIALHAQSITILFILSNTPFSCGVLGVVLPLQTPLYKIVLILIIKLYISIYVFAI